MTDQKGTGTMPPEQENQNGTVVYDIEDILAEYGRGADGCCKGAETEKPEEDAPEMEAPEVETPEAETPETGAEEGSARLSDSTRLEPDNLMDDISPEALFGLHGEEDEPSQEPEEEPQPEDGDVLPLSMEDVVASTVDAVQGEQAARQKKILKRVKKAQKKEKRSAGVRRRRRQPLPDVGREPELSEVAAFHKKRWGSCKRSFQLALPVVLLMWIPWILADVGIAVPFFCESFRNKVISVLVPQAVVLLLCGPLARAAIEGISKKTCTVYCSALAANLVTLGDGFMALLLPNRTEVIPLGGVAAVVALFCLWGLRGYHRGMWETLHTAAMGEPAYGVDCCEQGACKGRSTRYGFYTRASLPDSGIGLQRILMPVLLTCSLVFGVLSSLGQGRSQNILFNISVMLCAGSSLAFPMAFAVPFGKMASRLSRSGSAAAGRYGAAVLANAKRLVATDNDLFPPGTVAVNGLRLYGEERDHAIAYAATLTVAAGGSLGRCFEAMCSTDRIPLRPLDHFYIHDEDGLSGMIHGETVLVGSAAFMRHRAVKLPKTMPGKTVLCLAIDGQLAAIFTLKYEVSEPVAGAVRALNRNGLQLALAVRDGAITPRLLRTRFGSDGNAVVLEREHRLALSDTGYEAEEPNGLLYRDGLVPFVELVSGCRRLCHMEKTGNILAAIGSSFGVLVGYYLTLKASFAVLTPTMLLVYLLLWALPLFPLLWGVDRT